MRSLCRRRNSKNRETYSPALSERKKGHFFLAMDSKTSRPTTTNITNFIFMIVFIKPIILISPNII